MVCITSLLDQARLNCRTNQIWNLSFTPPDSFLCLCHVFYSEWQKSRGLPWLLNLWLLWSLREGESQCVGGQFWVGAGQLFRASAGKQHLSLLLSATRPLTDKKVGDVRYLVRYKCFCHRILCHLSVRIPVFPFLHLPAEGVALGYLRNPKDLPWALGTSKGSDSTLPKMPPPSLLRRIWSALGTCEDLGNVPFISSI